MPESSRDRAELDQPQLVITTPGALAIAASVEADVALDVLGGPDVGDVPLGEFSTVSGDPLVRATIEEIKGTPPAQGVQQQAQ